MCKKKGKEWHIYAWPEGALTVGYAVADAGD